MKGISYMYKGDQLYGLMGKGVYMIWIELLKVLGSRLQLKLVEVAIFHKEFATAMIYLLVLRGYY